MNDIPKLEQGTSIPRIVHQVFFGGKGGNILPNELRANSEALAQANPSWEYRLYDANDIECFIKAKFGDRTLALYRKIEPDYGAARVDFFRYLLMYHVGGIYLDIKSAARVSLDEIAARGSPFALVHWDQGAGGSHEGWGLYRELAHLPNGEFQQWHIVSVNGHPFLRSVIEYVLDGLTVYRPWTHGVGRKGVFRLTGPIAYTLAIAPIEHRHEHKTFANERQIGLTYNVLGEVQHRGIFRRHYAHNAFPIVRNANLKGFIDRLYTKPIELLYALLALKARLGVYARARPMLAKAMRAAKIIR